jgi:hypothetical protein
MGIKTFARDLWGSMAFQGEHWDCWRRPWYGQESATEGFQRIRREARHGLDASIRLICLSSSIAQRCLRGGVVSGSWEQSPRQNGGVICEASVAAYQSDGNRLTGGPLRAAELCVRSTSKIHLVPFACCSSVVAACAPSALCFHRCPSPSRLVRNVSLPVALFLSPATPHTRQTPPPSTHHPKRHDCCFLVSLLPYHRPVLVSA